MQPCAIKCGTCYACRNAAAPLMDLAYKQGLSGSSFSIGHDLGDNIGSFIYSSYEEGLRSRVIIPKIISDTDIMIPKWLRNE